MAYELKTQPTTAQTAAAYVAALDNGSRREDSRTLIAMMKRATGCAPKMWGPSIIGFDRYHYRYASGHEGEMCLVGFSPRKAALVLYLLYDHDEADALLARLGKHKLSKACLYINKLADVDLVVLERMIERTVVEMRKRYPDRKPGAKTP
jgi:hypothetical protein